jgi:hypothetical protein
MQRPFVCLSVLLVLFGCTLSLVAQQAASASGRQGQINAPVDPNEIFCTSGTACKTGFVPVFATAGGNATITSSIVTQSGSHRYKRFDYRRQYHRYRQYQFVRWGRHSYADDQHLGRGS